MEDEDSRTVWVGNFDPESTTQEVLYELFLQAGPLHYVKIPKDKATGRNKSFAFICYRHSVTVPYAIELLNGIGVYGRNLKVQSRNHQHLQQQGLASGPEGIHTLDPGYGKVNNSSGPSRPCGPQVLMPTPSLLGMPGNTVFAMAQQQIAILNACQPIPLSVNPLLNAPRERYSDRQGTINYMRNNKYQVDNYSNDHRKNHYNHQNAPYNSYSSRNSKDKSGLGGDSQHHHQGRFDYSRLGPPPSRDRHFSHGNDHHNRHRDRYDEHRSESQHSKYDSHRSSDGHYDRRHTSLHDSRNYRR